jgi:aryl-alcohol dehydrogenase-like predicted oxidoreductase
MDRYIERGGNFIDTANLYTLGHSEKIIGDHIGKHAHKRDRVVIATKFYSNLWNGDPNGGGAGRKSLISACEQSLRRLQTDYIDLYWMHLWDRHTPIEETMRALEDLVQTGKVRYLGFSDTPAWKVTQAQVTAHFRGWAPLSAIQIEYSLLERTVEGELLPMAQELGLAVTPWSPLKSGVLSGKYTRKNHGEQKAARGAWAESFLNEKAYTLIDELIAIAKSLDTTPARVALAWVQAQLAVTSTIIGARTIEQLDQNLGALDVHLPAESIAKLEALSQPQLDFPAGFIANAPSFMHGGIHVNGIDAPMSPVLPKPDSPRY